jgi:hypothetical protein
LNLTYSCERIQVPVEYAPNLWSFFMSHRHASLWMLPVLCAVVCFKLAAADGDKTELFNTFYLDGERVTYVLIIRPGTPRTFELHGPDNAHVAGAVRVSGEHITLNAGAVKRFLHYDTPGGNLKLGRRETDVATKGDLLGEMPPATAAAPRAVFLSEENWKKKGRPVFSAKARPAEPARPPVVDKPLVVDDPLAEPVLDPAKTAPPAPEPAIEAIGNFDDICGVYQTQGAKGRDSLRISAEGRFEYTRADGAKQAGAIIRDDNELTFVGGDIKRHFAIRVNEGGVEFKRRNVDVVKPAETLGSMPPQDREPLVWVKKEGLSPSAKPAPVEPLAPAKPAPAAPSVIDDPLGDPVLDKPAPVEPPAPRSELEKAPQPAAAAVADAKAIQGKFTHKHNLFIAETLEFKADGGVSYSASNGARASGAYKVENGKLTLSSGEVERRFSAALEGSTLVLQRAADDAPQFTNDLATLSPTVLKTARFERN